MPDTDTIKQRTQLVPIRDSTGYRTVTVRRLKWKNAKSFYANLATVVAKLFASRTSESRVASSESVPTEPGALTPDPVTAESGFFAKLPAIVRDSDALVNALLTGTTDFTAEQLNELDYGDVLALLEAALAVNLDDEIKNSCAGVAAKIRAFYAAAPAATLNPKP